MTCVRGNGTGRGTEGWSREIVTERGRLTLDMQRNQGKEIKREKKKKKKRQILRIFTKEFRFARMAELYSNVVVVVGSSI